ncbi:hypothetical protein G6F46_015283 [Rhizopus delemar]|nr:hypothetical protein G6F46_015283 [Rhizopus delemar]
MRASRGSAGCGKCSGNTGSWRSSSSSSIISRPSRVSGAQSSGTSAAAPISSRSSGEIDSTQHCSGRCAAVPGSTNTVRMRGSPLMRMPCGTHAGTQTPRVGGTIQIPASVSTTITPEIA